MISNFPVNGLNRLDVHVEKLFKDYLGTNVSVLDVRIIGRNVNGGSTVLVSMRSLQDKLEVLKQKHKMRYLDWKMFITDDLTREERSIQRDIRLRIKEEKLKGHDWKEGYQKVKVQGDWIPWEKLKEE